MQIRPFVLSTLIVTGLVVGAATRLTIFLQPIASGDDTPSSVSAAVPLSLDQLVAGQLKIIDLGWSLNDKNPYWPADDYEPFRLKTIATLDKNGVLSKAFFCPEHLGTHLDAPSHFEKNQPAVDQIEPANLFAHGVVIDVTMQSGTDADYRLTEGDIDEWEKAHGRIPEGAVVFLYTGWGRHWKNYPRYKNQDATGKMHFPGYTAEAAQYLIKERRAKGLGVDTLSIDFGLSKDFAVHHIVNAAGRYGLENVAHLDVLPPKGFYVVAAPIKIETGSGGPARIFAVLKN